MVGSHAEMILYIQHACERSRKYSSLLLRFPHHHGRRRLLPRPPVRFSTPCHWPHETGFHSISVLPRGVSVSPYNKRIALLR